MRVIPPCLVLVGCAAVDGKNIRFSKKTERERSFETKYFLPSAELTARGSYGNFAR